MAELFDVPRPAITKHLKNIFESGELDEQVVSSFLEHTESGYALVINQPLPPLLLSCIFVVYVLPRKIT
jgi:hypothetical protein